ncbi:hypothetical protein DEJ13_04480 [Curtobacterium sp. MCLR17_007]|uniref:hypothetical protein n=1 Tax=unclassified Curtobacterium TaxID=257496 RepID=UPI0006F1C3A9|nr:MULTISPECIES: hypothetical protein [unclassified Curtobacterium]KQS08875.1 hypothetical protein ASG04_08090 [Curtobacterium sp. Leaf183]WIB61098.1 hypothetical protein DEJ13_04480 [Curtobacterium sp. MCLR17_007]
MTSNERITISGTATSAPVITPDRIAEFPVRDDRTQREFLVRVPVDTLDVFVTPGTRVAVDGEAGWTVPGRPWLGESSRTLLQAVTIRRSELALAA